MQYRGCEKHRPLAFARAPIQLARMRSAPHALSAASAIRARLSSRPSTSMTSNRPGEASEPVSAARSGCAIAPSFSPPLRQTGAIRLPVPAPSIPSSPSGASAAPSAPSRCAGLRAQRLGGVGGERDRPRSRHRSGPSAPVRRSSSRAASGRASRRSRRSRSVSRQARGRTPFRAARRRGRRA